jgi:hypothetical protein
VGFEIGVSTCLFVFAIDCAFVVPRAVVVPSGLAAEVLDFLPSSIEHIITILKMKASANQTD